MEFSENGVREANDRVWVNSGQTKRLKGVAARDELRGLSVVMRGRKRRNVLDLDVK